jgi:ribosomal protein S18 acetylase RimI-like enzyme
MTYTIRPCEQTDLHDLILLCEEHAAYEQSHFDSTGKVALLGSAIFHAPARLTCYVIEVAGIIVGYYSFTLDYSTWDAQQYLHLDCLYLKEAFRGLGIGKHVMKNLIHIAAEKKCVNIQWQTPTFNGAAIKFYQAVGAQSKDKVRFTLAL